MHRILSNPLAVALVFASAFASSPLCAQTPNKSSRSSLQEATAIAEQLAAARLDPVRFAIDRAESARRDLEHQEHRGAGAGEKAVSRYAQRLAALVAVPRAETLSELTAALHRPEVELQLIALTALREGASVGRERSEALLLARQLLLDSPEPVVRRQAFEAYSRWGNQDDVLSLSQELGRTPGPVRDLAVREWLRIERERR